MTTSWAENASIGRLHSEDVRRAGVVFRYQDFFYRTTGRSLAQGGMGSVVELQRRHYTGGETERVVGKTFHASYLNQLRTDELTRRDHQANLAAISRIAALEHPNLLPTYLAAPIEDNYLFVTPLMGVTLLEAVSKHRLTPRGRTKLLIQALDGLGCLHGARILHRDFTLRNILLDGGANLAYLFDFDLAVSLDDVGPATYRSYYKGRLFGSPGWSVAPETVDHGLLDSPLSTALDVYAIGGALHGLFTDEMLYGQIDDMWALVQRIGEGVVHQGVSQVHYPNSVPVALRRVIDRCLERDPSLRYPSVNAVVADLRGMLRELPNEEKARARRTSREVSVVSRAELVAGVSARNPDPTITADHIDRAATACGASGYAIERSLGRVKGHPIFLAVPRPDWIAAGQFPDANVFPKLVTVVDLAKVEEPLKLVDAWQQFYWPVLKKVRQGLLTNLHRVVYDDTTGTLLLFSEYVGEPQFGSRLAEVDITLEAALALAHLVVQQVAALHQHGMAHNNIHPGALLLKGGADTRAVLPAMIGLVDPARGPEAMGADCRALAGMALTWLRPARVASLHPRLKPMFDGLRTKLSVWAFDLKSPAPIIAELGSLISDGLSLIDFNFSVLRDAGGDLQEYALLLLSVRLYHLLWPALAAPPSRRVPEHTQP